MISPQYIPMNSHMPSPVVHLEVFLPAPEVEVTKALDLDLPEGHGGHGGLEYTNILGKSMDNLWITYGLF